MRLFDRSWRRIPRWGDRRDPALPALERDPVSARRWPAVGAIVALLAAGIVGDHLLGDDGPAATTTVSAAMPAAAPASARSSAWFCAGATAEPGSPADGTVVVANAGRRILTASITVFPTMGSPRQAAIAVEPARRATLRLGDLVVAPFASALVELDGGQAAVELETVGPTGYSVTPCASASAQSWYFAEGVTTSDASEQLLLFNPFPDDALVDFSFTTEEERARPLALTGVSVAGRSMLAVDVGQFVQRREGVTARVTARRGRIVVNRLQSFDGTGSHQGMSLTLGSPGPSPLWYFATGLVADGVSERFQIYNPENAEAEVEIAIDVDEGEVEPLLLTVPSESRLTVVAADESRIPKGALHAVTVRSTNDVGVVVERSSDSARPPAASVGFASSLGALTTATEWLVVAGGADDNFDSVVALSNPGPDPARVSIEVLLDGTRRPVAGLGAIEVPAGGRSSVRLGDHVKGAALPLVVSANHEIVVERTLTRLTGPGTTTVAGIPLS